MSIKLWLRLYMYTKKDASIILLGAFACSFLLASLMLLVEFIGSFYLFSMYSWAIGIFCIMFAFISSVCAFKLLCISFLKMLYGDDDE